MKKIIKHSVQVFFVTIVLLVIIDQLLAFVRPSLLYPANYDIADYHRFPRPYIGFAGKPNVIDHNELGYRWKIDKTLDSDSVRIAFFGGSTGYGGDPPIANLLETYLKSEFGKKIKIANFSVVSSNHRQHIHNIIESHNAFKPDLIVFYGGYNETAQTAFYDPRPGYPYNFFYRDETSHWKKLLLERSPIINLLNRVGVKYGWFDLTPLTGLRANVDIYSDSWKNQVLITYFETLEYANKLAKTFGSTRCSKESKFRAFYQPYQVPDNLKTLHLEIRRGLKDFSYLYDVSDTFLGSEFVFTDIVHVNQDGNEKMARKMFDLLKADTHFSACLKQNAK